jgi:hypothetical protein
MERLILLSQDKATLGELKEYLTKTLNTKLIKAVLNKEDATGYAEANDIIKVALKEIDDMFKPEKKTSNLNESE